jgi:hypothetical protein
MESLSAPTLMTYVTTNSSLIDDISTTSNGIFTLPPNSINRIYGITFAPQVTTEPKSQSVKVGTPVQLTVAVRGSPEPTVQWQLNGNNISGATEKNYSFTAGASTAGVYTVVMTNAVGSVTSCPATVSVQSRRREFKPRHLRRFQAGGHSHPSADSN